MREAITGKKLAPDAQSVGSGVPRVVIERPARNPRSELSSDSKPIWLDEPQVKNQIEGDDWKPDKRECRIFDLSTKEGLADYNKLLTDLQNPMRNFFLGPHERKWCEALSGWKVLVEIQFVKFRKIRPAMEGEESDKNDDHEE